MTPTASGGPALQTVRCAIYTRKSAQKAWTRSSTVSMPNAKQPKRILPASSTPAGD
jgi:hypothetical protein